MANNKSTRPRENTLNIGHFGITLEYYLTWSTSLYIWEAPLSKLHYSVISGFAVCAIGFVLLIRLLVIERFSLDFRKLYALFFFLHYFA